MNFRCLAGRHDWKDVETIYLKPKTDGRLKLKVDDFDRCEIGDAKYWGARRRCRLCGKEVTEIT